MQKQDFHQVESDFDVIPIALRDHKVECAVRARRAEKGSVDESSGRYERQHSCSILRKIIVVPYPLVPSIFDAKMCMPFIWSSLEIRFVSSCQQGLRHVSSTAKRVRQLTAGGLD